MATEGEAPPPTEAPAGCVYTGLDFFWALFLREFFITNLIWSRSVPCACRSHFMRKACIVCDRSPHTDVKLQFFCSADYRGKHVEGSVSLQDILADKLSCLYTVTYTVLPWS